MREKQFENKIKDFLKSLDKCWYFKHWAGAYSKVGVPDILCCINGKFVAIEVKSESGKLSTLQQLNIERINEAGGYALVLYPKDFESFKRDVIEIANEL